MITYAYWLLIIALAAGAFWVLGMWQHWWRPATAVSALILAVGWGAYYFHYQQVFVKRWGGVMTIATPQGRYHLGATWKDDNLWVETYDPATDTCHFNEYSKGNLLQGKVVIRDCNPLLPQAPARATAAPAP